MKNKTLRAKNLQKVDVFFNIRPYLYIIIDCEISAKIRFSKDNENLLASLSARNLSKPHREQRYHWSCPKTTHKISEQNERLCLDITSRFQTILYFLLERKTQANIKVLMLIFSSRQIIAIVDLRHLFIIERGGNGHRVSKSEIDRPHPKTIS